MRRSVFALIVLAISLLGDECPFRPIEIDRSLVPQIGRDGEGCATLQSALPAALSFAGTGAVSVADSFPPTLFVFDATTVPPLLGASIVLGPDSDGNGTNELVRPLFTDLFAPLDAFGVPSPSFALATAQLYEEVLFFNPTIGSRISLNVAVPANFAASDNKQLPAPGTTRLQTGLSTQTCLRPPSTVANPAVDSEGTAIGNGCDGTRPSYLASFTSGVTLSTTPVAGTFRAFVSVANATAASAGQIFRPGAVLVYDFDFATATLTPHPLDATAAASALTAIFTRGFDPIDVVAHQTLDPAGNVRRFVLVAVSGAPNSTVPASRLASIEVIDADALRVVATYPLGAVDLSNAGLVVDPAGRVAVAGGAFERSLYAVDLAPLATFTLPAANADPVDLSASVIHGATNPLPIAERFGGATVGCPPVVGGIAFDFAGTRLFATEFCDGTLSTFDFVGTTTVPAFTRDRLINITARFDPILPDTPHGPTRIAVRPVPLTPTSGPDVFAIVSLPNGLLCPLNIDQQAAP